MEKHTQLAYPGRNGSLNGLGSLPLKWVIVLVNATPEDQQHWPREIHMLALATPWPTSDTMLVPMSKIEVVEGERWHRFLNSQQG